MSQTREAEAEFSSVDLLTVGISVVIPTLNEAQNIAALLLRCDQTLREAGASYELIVVDDHSTDNTLDVARETVERYRLPAVLLTKQGQRGKSYSLIEGFATAQYPVLGMIDGDLQYPPEAFIAMAARMNEADIIVGDRRKKYRHANRLRGSLSQGFSTLISRGIFGINTDMQSGMKVFTRRSYDSVIIKPGPWSFDLEFITQARFKGYQVANVPIDFGPRNAGTSKVNITTTSMELMRAAVRLRVKLTMLLIIYWLMRLGLIPRSESYLAGAMKQHQRPLDLNAIRFSSDIHYYQTWLIQMSHDALAHQRRSVSDDYFQRSTQTIQVGRKTIQPFSTLARGASAIQSFTPGQIAFMAVVVAGLVGGMIRAPLTTLMVLIALVITLYIRNLFQSVRLVNRSLDITSEEHIDDRIVDQLASYPWPPYTILCPLFKEVAVVPQFVRAMAALDYPADRLQILFLTEEVDAATRDAILALGLPPNFEVLTVPAGEPQTKPRACNFGLLHATGEYTVIYDAEDVPEPLQLKKAVLAFSNFEGDVACVQAKLNFYNPTQNLLTRWFTIEYTLWFDVMLPGMQSLNIPLPLGGTSNHFRTAILRRLGGWDPFNVTEDCDLGLRLGEHHLRTIVLDSTTMEEANSRVKNWVRQRSRWIKGYMQTYLVHMRQPWRYAAPSRWRDFGALQFIIGGTPATFFLNPIMWIMLAIYVVFYPLVVGVYHVLYPAPLFYAAMICLIFGNFLYIYTSLIACAKRGLHNLTFYVFLMPVYWALMSVAATLALFQLVFRPHYWEKTQHGLHLTQAEDPIVTFETVKMKAQ